MVGAVAFTLGPSPVLEAAGGAARVVGDVLGLADHQLDYARAKLAFDRIVDPSTDETALLARLERMAATAKRLAGLKPNVEARLKALRKLIYRPGPWNGHRAFDYDHDGFAGLQSKLLANYLRTRRGNCVSMPVLFLILADRLGVDMRLAAAPHHMTLRYETPRKGAVNLGATSGANPARDAWYRQIMPMSDRALESGLYLRTLSRRESVAFMATTVIEHLNDQRRYEEAIAVCEIILRHSPRCGHTLVNLGNACWKILRVEYLGRYQSEHLIPLALKGRFQSLVGKNRAAFAAAEDLGWEPMHSRPR